MSPNARQSPAHPQIFAGVDGCRGGWFAAWVGREGRWQGGVFARFAPLIEAVLGDAHPETLRLLVDIPIGLPSGPDPRRCDVEARRILGLRRGSSVFSAPPRAVLEAGSWEEGLARARAASGRGISLQAWHLVPKIREVDTFLRADPSWVGRIREAHPELLFRSLMKGNQGEESGIRQIAGVPEPDLPSKRTPDGFRLRRALLESVAPGVSVVIEEALAAHPRRLLARDDILDALVAAVVARLGDDGALHAVPEVSERDGEGLPMAIVVGAGAPESEVRSGPQEGK